MEDHVICPHCGQPLDESIPPSLVGSIQVKCPFCDLVYSFQRKDVDYIEEAVESYLSVGPFRRKIVLSDRGEQHEGYPLTRQFSCLILCLLGPLIIFGIYWVIAYLIWIIG